MPFVSQRAGLTDLLSRASIFWYLPFFPVWLADRLFARMFKTNLVQYDRKQD